MNLEQVLSGSKYESNLITIKKHSEILFKKDTFHHIYYTLHGTDHSKAIISKLDKLVDGINPGSELTKPEIFYLLASVYLHDVGMLHSYPEDEDRAKTISAQKRKPFTKEDLIRDEHHLRSGKYIVEQEDVLGLDHVESECVKLICEGHRVVKLDTENYNDRLVGDERIRIRLLSALLRFSDELDISYQRAPKELMKLLMEHMPDYSRLQWLKHYYTNGVGISIQQSNGIRKTTIEIQTQYPDRERGRKITDELIFKPIEKSLSSVDRILLVHGLNIILTPPETFFKENLDKIPEHIYDRYLGQQFKVSLQIPQTKSFVGRNSDILKLSNLLDKNIIIIEGIAGIGKTYVASRFAEEIKDKFQVHWYGEVSEASSISSVMGNLAIFLNDNGKSRLFNSIENFGYNDIDVLVTILKEELINNKFAIFFDNYHKADDELNTLMKQLLYIESSKIILITREELFFYNVVDIEENRVAKIKIDSWDYEDTKKMFRIRGIETTEETTLREIHDRLHGHPQYLNLFCILAQKSKSEALLEKLPKARQEAHSYLESEVYNSLETNEKFLIKIIAIYRIPETIEAFCKVNDFTDIDEIINGLMHKFLINEIGFGKYTVHEIIMDYCLSDVKKKKTLRKYHISAAEYYLSKGDNPDLLLEASYHFIEAGENEKSAGIMINNANEFIERGFWRKIEEPLNDAIQTLNKYRHDRWAIEWAGLAHLHIGNFYVKRGDLNLAMKHAQECSKAFMRITKSKHIFSLDTLFGSIYSELNDINKSEDYFNKSLKFAEENNNEELKIVAYGNIGNIYLSRGDAMKAIELFSNGLDFYEKQNSLKGIEMACYSIAGAYLDLKDYSKAYDFIKKSIKICKEMGATYKLARSYVTYAIIYFEDPINKGNLDPVLHCLSKSLEIYENIGHVREEASVRSRIGNYYIEQKDYKSAIDNYERSVSIYKSLNAELKLSDVYINISKCYSNLNDDQKSFEYFEKSVGPNSDISYKLSLAECYIISNEFEKAVKILKNVLDETKENQFFKCLAYVLMSISLFLMGQEKDAYAYFKELIQYHSINKYVEVAWDFSNISTIFEELESLQRILIKDLISLIQNKTIYPIIRFDIINIEREEFDNYAEVFHPFIGSKTITKDDESLKRIMKNLIGKGYIEIDINESSIMGVERDNALMILGFLYKKGRIDFIEIAPNNLKIGLTNRGKKIKLTSGQ